MDYELLSKQETADLLKISSVSLDRIRRRGEFIQPTMIGRTIKFRSDRVKEWLDSK